ncbi:MAG: glycosyltransferase [Bacteroidales bacterium]
MKNTKIPFISIITATYNAAQHLSHLIASLRGQSIGNFEWVVADGGSTDGTLEILSQVDDLNIIVDSRPDCGVYDAFNRAVSLSSGDYLLFLGADDYLIADLASLASILVDDKTIYYGDVYMPKKHILFGGKYTRRRLAYHNICHQSLFYPRSVFENYSYDIKYKVWADYYLNICCMADKDFKFQYIKTLVSFYNDFDGISDNSEDSLFLKNQVRINYKFFPIQDFIYFIARKGAIGLFKKTFKYFKDRK